LAAAEILMAVINDVLDLSKIEAGWLDLVDEDYSIETTLNDAWGVVGVEAGSKELDLVVAIDAGVPSTLRGDGRRVRQVLLNFLRHAVEFTSRGAVTVTVTVQQAAGADQLRVEVSDTATYRGPVAAGCPAVRVASGRGSDVLGRAAKPQTSGSRAPEALGLTSYGCVTVTFDTANCAGRLALLGVPPAPPVWVWMITNIGVDGIVYPAAAVKLQTVLPSTAS